MSALDELAQAAAGHNGTGDADSAAEHLTALFDLASVGLAVTGARVVGRGGSATVYLYLSDSSEIVFEKQRDMAKPQTLMVELATCTGATPTLKQPQAIRALALTRALATHQLADSIDELSQEWGVTFLQSAQTLDADMDDQQQRWGAFSELERHDPAVAARTESTSVARASIVLRHRDGTRYVRTGWFRAHVRGEDMTVSPQEIRQRMLRVGWQRRGGEGLIKATRPGNPGQLSWRFYTIPPEWEDAN